MLLIKQAKTLKNIQYPLNTIIKTIRSNSTKTATEETIEIPNRIQRSPTDILRALASTVGNDPTAAHYKYHDDPYLIPASNVAKRTYAMAQESGRKSAHWIRQENRKFFQHSEAEPPIPVFAPKMVFTEDSEVDETSLNDLIKNSEVSDAIFVYKLMQSKGISVSDDTKQSLLELLCFYNNEDALPEEFIEERWFRQGNMGRGPQRKTWKDAEFAEELFNQIEPKTSQVYAAIIRGMCKYSQVDRAWALFQESIEKQIELDTKTFNSLLSIINFLKDSPDLRWELCLDLLTQMKDRKLHPDLGTLNSILCTLSTIGNHRLQRNSTLKVLSEFKKLGIEPSLGSWYYVLISFCKERGPVSHVLIDIMNEIEGKEFKIMDVKDTFFFVTAMDICRNHLHDKNLAKRVDKLLHTGENYDLIGNSYKESIYYRHFLALLCQTETLEEFMKTYDLLVPNVYTPEPGIMEEILKVIDTNGALELIPRMWSDIIIFDHTYREGLLNRILQIMTANKPSTEIESHQGLNEIFATIAWDIYTKIEDQNADNNRIQRLSFTGQILGDILTLISRAGDFEKAMEVFNKIDKQQHKIPGMPSLTAMQEFIEICIIEKSPSQAIICLEYCAENGLEAQELARRINKRFTLSGPHISKIKGLVGEDCLQESRS